MDVLSPLIKAAFSMRFDSSLNKKNEDHKNLLVAQLQEKS